MLPDHARCPPQGRAARVRWPCSTGLTFVCLSGAKRLVDLIVEPMRFDRIGNLGNSSTMKARLQEEVRLADLAQSTTVRYTEMGVLSAVADGN